MSSDYRHRLANRIVCAAFRFLFPASAERITAIQDIVDAIRDLDANSRAGRALPRRLQDAADQIADRLGRLAIAEYPDLNEEERNIAVKGVESALLELNLSRSDFIREGMSSAKLTALLEPLARRRWKSERLSEAAESYGRFYLAEAAAYVCALTIDLPGFDSDVAWETYILTRKIEDTLDRAVASVVLPRFKAGVPHELSQFEAGYRTDITTNYKYISLFGLNLPVELCRQPVEVAYIRLRSSRKRRTTSPPSGVTPPEESQPKPTAVDAAFAEIATIQSTAAAKLSLPLGARILLTGTAGSGKTTITQWLAVKMADRNLPESLSLWSDCLPFVVQLRYVFKGHAQPTYDDMIRAASYRGPEVPGTWVQERMSEGRAVVILDGFDELSDQNRLTALAWLEKLLAEHPRCHFVITSRPDNLDYQRFFRQGFDRLDLLPMNEPEALECIERWFAALLSGANPLKVVEYKRRRDQLLHDFQNHPTVRDLCETPLLCAMLCAFYAYNLSEVVPQTRIELYERVVTALIDLRERQRSGHEAHEELFNFTEKMLLLEALALHLTVESTTTIRIEPLRIANADIFESDSDARRAAMATSALDIVKEQLDGMIATRVPPPEALEYLLARSVVFQRVAHNEAQFTHRSIQEYLTGCAYSRGQMDELLVRAASPEWRRVIVFAAGSARQEESTSRLIAGILDLAEEGQPNRRELLLLAAECITAAGRLDPRIADRARDLIGSVLPPNTIEEARSLSGLGEELLGWLSGHQDKAPEVIGACIWAAARVGGPTAMKIIAQYAVSAKGSLSAGPLIEAWDRFDAETYARDVLANVDVSASTLPIKSAAQVQALSHVRSAHRIRFEFELESPDFSFLPELDQVEALDCGKLSSLRSIAGISRLPNLKQLNLSGNKLLTDLGELPQLHSLEELHLANCQAMTSIQSVRTLSTLRILVLDGCPVTDFSPLASLTNLVTLSLDRCPPRDLSFCASLTRLKTLRATALRESLVDTTGIADCPDLRRLSIALGDEATARLPELTATALKEVTLTGTVSVRDLEGLAGYPTVTVLRAHRVLGLHDLTCLSELRNLTELRLAECGSLRSGEGLEQCTRLRVLELRDCLISDVDFARALVNLESVLLDECILLSDITGLIGLPRLRHVSMTGGVAGITEDMLERLKASASGPLTVNHDPINDPFEIREYIAG